MKPRRLGHYSKDVYPTAAKLASLKGRCRTPGCDAEPTEIVISQVLMKGELREVRDSYCLQHAREEAGPSLAEKRRENKKADERQVEMFPRTGT